MAFGMVFEGEDKIHTNKNYVFYKRLRTDFNHHYENFYEAAIKDTNTYLDAAVNLESIANYFYQLRDNSFSKECNLLRKQFNVDTSIYSYDSSAKEVGTKLIEAFNESLQLKDVFKRNLLLIQKTNGQKGLMSWFSSYFSKYFNLHKNEIIDDINQNIGNGMIIHNAVLQAINNWMVIIVKESLEWMFTEADVENGIKNNNPELKDAYKELYDAIQGTKKAALGNEFVQSMVDMIGADTIAKNIEKELNGKTGSDFKKALRSFDINSLNKNVHYYGGLAMENFGSFAAQFVADNIKGTVTGRTGQKADYYLTVDLPVNAIEDWIGENDFGDREENVKAMIELQNKLEGMNGTYIEVSAKNYTLNNDFHGFSAGDPIKLSTFKNILDTVSATDVDKFIHSILQTIPGAIGDDINNYREDVELSLARAIAAFLFDDFNVMDYQFNPSTANAVHLLYLDGVYFPMSFYFHLLAEAFDETVTSMLQNYQLFKVNLKTPGSILFPQRNKKAEKGDWERQSVSGLEETVISFHFLQGFKSLMKSLDFNLE